MNVIFDILGSFIIRAAITVISLNLMIMMNDSLFRATEQSYLNDIVAVPAEVITSDLRLAGYHASKNFVIALREDVQFCTDTGNGDASPDTIRFYLGAPDAVTHHQMLYRVINSGIPSGICRQVDTLIFTYFDMYGGQLAYRPDRDSVKSIFVQLRLESENVITTFLSGNLDSLRLKAFWENHIFPKNL